MSVLPGEVALLKFPYSDPPKQKFCLCVCLETSHFLVISSKHYPWAAASTQMKIFKEELGALSHESWLDMSTLYAIEIPRGAAVKKWPLKKSAIQRILHAVPGISSLSPAQKECIIRSLTAE